MSASIPGTSTRVIFWLAFVPVILGLIFSLLMALEAIIVFGEITPLTLGIRFAVLAAPIPQITSLMRTFDYKRNHDWTRATTRMLVHMIIVSGVISIYLLAVFQ